MENVKFLLNNEPGQLALMGRVLGEQGISIEGGGAWAVDGTGHANFLFADGEKASRVLSAAGFHVVAVNRVIVQKLRQDVPGQLGLLTQHMAENGVNIDVLYSDHYNQLILVVDNEAAANTVAEQWTREF